MTLDWRLVYWAFALVVSSWIGWFALRIWSVSGSSPSPHWVWYQRWLNFFGSLVGWAAGFYVISAASARKLDGADLAIGLLAIVGISGYLPASVSALSFSLKWLGQKYAGLQPPN